MDPYAIMAIEAGGWATPTGDAPSRAPVWGRTGTGAVDARWVERALEEHGPEVWRYLVHRLGSRDLADDLLGDVFLALVHAGTRLESSGIPVRAWLFRVASRRAADYFRKQKRAPRVVKVDSHDVPDHPRCADERLDATDWRRALSSLSAAHQDVLILHHLHGVALEQIAQIERRGLGTIKSRLSRARQALRRALGATTHGGER